MSRPADVWAGGSAYEQYVGRWSRLVAREFLGWAGAEPGGSWIDVGCGTGALSEAILRGLEPARVVALDPSLSYLEQARRGISDPRIHFAAGRAEHLPARSGDFDVAVSGLVLNFVPVPAAALAEMARVLRPGGTLAVYVWDYAEGMQLMRWFWDAAVALDSAAASLDEGRRFPICRPDPLTAMFRGAGVERVESRAIDVPTPFRSFDDYWEPVLGGQGPAPGYVAGLTEAARARLRDRLRGTMPVQSDGSIHLVARAWAVRGRTPVTGGETP
jgi:SAM-dependent methyltransferase